MLEFITFCSDIPIKIASALVLATAFTLFYIRISKRNGNSRLLNFLYSAALVLVFVFSISTLVCNVPYWDDYDAILHYLSRPFTERVGSIFDFHNEHRIVIPRLVFEVVYAICGMFDFRVCIIIGDLILLGYVFVLGKNLTRNLAWRYFIPFVALFLSLANYENTLWALTSIQSHGVLLFALLAVVFFDKRERTTCFIMALVFAVAATLTSGSGLGIWPCLVLMGLKQYADTEEGFKWCRFVDLKSGMRQFFRFKPLIFMFTMAAVLFSYLKGFVEKASQHAALAMDVNLQLSLFDKLVNSLDFGISFLGAVVPYHKIALPIGLVIVVMVFFVLYNFKRVKDDVTFFFLLYLLSVVASGMLFRANLSKCGGEVACLLRYGIVTFSIIACLVVLNTRLIRQMYPRRLVLWEGVMCLVLFGALLINFGVQILGYELVHIRKSNLERGLQKWPESSDELQYPDKSRASMILKRADETGVFKK